MSGIIPSLDTAASVNEFKLKGKRDSSRIFCFLPSSHLVDTLKIKATKFALVSSPITFLLPGGGW